MRALTVLFPFTVNISGDIIEVFSVGSQKPGGRDGFIANKRQVHLILAGVENAFGDPSVCAKPTERRHSAGNIHVLYLHVVIGTVAMFVQDVEVQDA